MQRKLEILTNVSIVVLCLTVSGILIKGHFFAESPPEPTQAVAKGEIVDLPEALVDGNAEVVVMAALAPGCGFCNESMKFYRSLTAQRGVEDDGLRIVAVVRDADQVEQERQVLDAAGVEVDEIFVTDFNTLGVPGTPMLIVTDRQGEVLGAWLGKLDENQEREVFDMLGFEEGLSQALLSDETASTVTVASTSNPKRSPNVR